MFAPIVKWSTIRAIISMAAALNWKISALDVITTFLNGQLTKEVYMQQPHVFSEPGLEHLVYPLNRNIYSLKQSPCTWNFEIDSFLMSIDWRRSSHDPSLYFYSSGSTLVVILLFVDDLLIIGNSNAKSAR